MARDGQHIGKLVTKSENVVPWSTIAAWVRGITRMLSSVWSSVMITTMLGASASTWGTVAALRSGATSLPQAASVARAATTAATATTREGRRTARGP